MITLALTTDSEAFMDNMTHTLTGQAFPFEGAIESNVGAFFTNVTISWLPTIPDLTTISTDHNKMGNAALKVNADKMCASHDLREVCLMLEMHSLDLTITA